MAMGTVAATRPKYWAYGAFPELARDIQTALEFLGVAYVAIPSDYHGVLIQLSELKGRGFARVRWEISSAELRAMKFGDLIAELTKRWNVAESTANLRLSWQD